MKLRLRADTLRLRLSRTDVATFRDVGRIEAATRFPGGASLRYVLERGEGDGFGARLDGGSVSVRLPRSLAETWTNSETVGIDGEVRLDDGAVLRLLIEKDFACLTENRPEDQDAYPHPHESC